MKLNLTLIYLVLNLCWTSSKAQSAKINLKLENASLKELIQEIEKQSDYYFIYQDDVFDNDQRINLRLENSSINQIITELEKQVSVHAEIITHQIILTKPKAQVLVPPSPNHKIIGKVINDTGDPIVGVTVVIKGSYNGTLTNANGNFEIEVPVDSATLVFSFIGMISEEVRLGSQTELNVVLRNKTINIEEVVAVGYGTIKRVENTGSIASMKATAFKEFPTTTFEQGLKGRITGVQITSSSGQPGAGVSVRIRGASSIAGGNEPLYVIDGIPIFNSDVRELNGLSGISSGDISSVEVLKDAIATSIYGSRAANGVILITTKNGTPGKMQIEYDSYMGISTLRKKLPIMNGTEYINYATEYYANAQNISEEQKQQNLEAINLLGNANTDWQDEIYRTAFQHGHNISFSGGNQNSLYFASLNYINENGIVENTDFEQLGFRLNVKNRVSSWLEISGRTSFSKVIQNGFLAGDGSNTRNNEKSGIGTTLLISPTIPVYDEDGKFSSAIVYPFSYEDVDNPVAMLQALDKNTMYYFIGGLDANITLTESISNTLRLGVEYTNKTHDYYLPKSLIQLGAQTAELEDSKRVGNVFEDFFTLQTKLSENISFKSIAGFSIQQEEFQSINLAGAVFPSDKLQNSAIQGAESVSTPITTRIKSTLASFFGRVELGYLNKYQLSLSVRQDGSSVFSASNKWATFPAAAFAWRLSEEEFLKKSKVSNLKLRTSWGLAGNQAIQPYGSLYVGEIVNTGQGAGSGINAGLAPNLPNKDLTWETTEQFNLGLDFGVNNEKIRVVFDYYLRNTKDLLARVAIPESTGYSFFVDNVGAVKNEGFELLLGADLINQKDWHLDFNFNFSKNKNIVKATKDNQDILPSRTDDATRTTTIVRVGEPLFSYFMPKFLGLDDSGKPMYEDLNNDGIIDNADNQISGSPLPEFFYGLDLYLKYRKITLSMNWHGVNGARLNNVPLSTLVTPEPTANRMKNIRDYYPSVTDDYIVWNSDRFIEDASYLRLKNIRLSYQMSNISTFLDDFTLYISGQNMLTFTKYSGYEPDVNSFSGDNQFQGVDYAAFPSAKTITMGVNLKF